MKMAPQLVSRKQLSLDDCVTTELVDIYKISPGSELGNTASLGSLHVTRYIEDGRKAIVGDPGADKLPTTDSSGIVNLSGVENTHNNEVVNLPILHQSQKLQDAGAISKNTGTIKRPFNANNSDLKLNIMPVNAKSRTGGKEGKGGKSKGTVTKVAMAREGTFEKADKKALEETNNSISPFPPVEDDEIKKHMSLNEEAEKNSKLKDHDVHPDYLKRLKLERKSMALERQKEKARRKLQLEQLQKRLQAKARQREAEREFFMMEPTPTTIQAAPQPRQPKDNTPKPKPTILGFRYSQAIEEYYRGQISHMSCVTLLSDIDSSSNTSSNDEMVNGWFVRNMGANVLNLNARTLPSCNPVEIRLRRKQARMRTRDSFMGIHNNMSRDSMASHVIVRSRDSLTKLQIIEEGQRDAQPHHGGMPERNEEIVLTESLQDTGDMASARSLPCLHSFTEDSPRTAMKSITLRLPPIVSEET